ncbi:MAG: Gfo/Idh/MocA family oxidoreductase [Deltaproteobacteria bacterium]|jgi:predicted dehydrogenase|nr:Gfo/Idh/MocA family oxidoreductase [Deltaproteobacteria bacterium]
MARIGVIGCGYWGPNLIRNFVTCPETELVWACDLDEIRLQKVLRPYPSVRQTTDLEEVLKDNGVDAIAIATPVHSHFPIAKACLESGKHVLIEKPLASSVAQGEELVNLAEKNNLRLMCDHTFCYTGAVRKIQEIVKSGVLGDLHYFDSVRVNLGLFQQDVNVVWDLAPHDLSIVDFVVDEKPVLVSAHGVSHAGNDIENIAYISLSYQNSFIAHFHVNWLSPVKVRKTMIAGSEKMLVWNDLDQAEKIKIYDKGIEVKQSEREQKERLLVSYRSGDMYAPKIDQVEALSLMVKEFADCIQENRSALTDGKAGLRVLRVLDAANRSIKADGANVRIDY